MKKIVFVIDDINGTGGVERVTSFLANSFSESYEVSIVSLQPISASLFYHIQENVSLIGLSKKGLFLNIELGKTLKKEKPDIIVSMSMGRLSLRVSTLKHIFNIRTRLILSEHNAYRSSGLFVRVLKLLSYAMADQLILLTDFDRKIIERKIKKPVFVIPNFSIYENAEIDPSQRQKIVLCVGRISYQKGFDRAVKIWKEASIPGWKLIIVGKGDNLAQQELTSLINQIGVADSVELWKPTKELYNIYASSSIYMMTSRFEGLPLVLIESKSFGIPAIAFDCETGPAEIIVDGVDGYLIKESESDFAKKLKQLASDEKLRQQFSISAMDNAKKYSQVKYINAWEEILNK